MICPECRRETARLVRGQLCKSCYEYHRRAGTLPPNRRSRRVTVCAACGQSRPHEAHGLCAACYNQRRTKPPSTAVKDAIGRLLPIPPQRPCPGVPGEVRCARRAQPGSPYCLRCGPIAAAAGLSTTQAA